MVWAASLLCTHSFNIKWQCSTAKEVKIHFTAGFLRLKKGNESIYTQNSSFLTSSSSLLFNFYRFPLVIYIFQCCNVVLFVMPVYVYNNTLVLHRLNILAKRVLRKFSH